METGKRIKDRRTYLGISAEQIADSIGVSPATIYRYESGDIESMKINRLTPLATILRTSEAYLLGLVDDPSITSVPLEGGNVFTEDEMSLIDIYRQLDQAGQSSVRQFAAFTLDRQNDIPKEDADKIKKSESA